MATLIEAAVRAYKNNGTLVATSPGLEWLRIPLERVIEAIEPMIRESERIRMRDKAATATVHTTEGGLSVLTVDDPHGVDWTPVSIGLIKELIDNRNAEVERIKAEERERIKALCRWLVDEGHITPLAQRMLTKVPVPDPPDGV